MHTEANRQLGVSEGTGCVSVSCDPLIKLEKIVETFDPDNGTIWIDLYLLHESDCVNDEQYVEVLHRGRLFARNVTSESGYRPDCENLDYRHPASLSQRLAKLHDLYDPLRFLENNDAILDGSLHRGFTDENVITTVLPEDTTDHADKPYTLWRIGPFLGASHEFNRRYWLRMQLQMADETIRKQLGDEFAAYGESVLLQLILLEDLPEFQRTGDKEEYAKYRKRLDQFLGGPHEVPKTYEYVVVGPPSEGPKWLAQSLTPLLYPLLILDEELSRSTYWYIIDNSLNTHHEQSPRQSWFQIRFSARGRQAEHTDRSITRRAEAAT